MLLSYPFAAAMKVLENDSCFMNNIYYLLTFTPKETHQAYPTALLSVCNNMPFLDLNGNGEKQVSFSSRQ